MERHGLTGFELLVLVLGGAAASVIGAVWGGAALALLVTGHGHALPVSAAATATGSLPGHLSDPAGAWPSPHGELLPDPVVYWLCTAIVAAVMTAAGVVVARVLSGSKVGTSRRRPLGVDARPRFAKARDLAPLLVRSPQPGRFVVARFGRRLVATEATPVAGEKHRARRGYR